jgi:hypothetical protein
MISAKPSQNGTPNEKSSEIIDIEASERLPAHTIRSINALPAAEKRAAYTQLIPVELLERFKLAPELVSPSGEDLLHLGGREDGTDTEMALFHQPGFRDPILFGHITDTITGHVHVLLYILNDPYSPRFDVDQTTNGSPTQFGTSQRNLEAEEAAMR